MKLSNTLIVNEILLPNSKKAFTLAEVLITLSILGVVAALTIPSLVNRQSQMAAIVKLKKAISQFEQVAEVYMAENEATNIGGMIRTTSNCDNLSNYFKTVNTEDNGCTFTTADGVQWKFTYAGNNGVDSIVVVYDSETSPKYGVAMKANDSAANKTPVASNDASLPASPAAPIYTSAEFLKISKPADVDSATVLKAKAS